MYVLPESEIKDVKPSNILKNNIHHLRSVRLQRRLSQLSARAGTSLFKIGGELVISSIEPFIEEPSRLLWITANHNAATGQGIFILPEPPRINGRRQRDVFPVYSHLSSFILYYKVSYQDDYNNQIELQIFKYNSCDNLKKFYVEFDFEVYKYMISCSLNYIAISAFEKPEDDFENCISKNYLVIQRLEVESEDVHGLKELCRINLGEELGVCIGHNYCFVLHCVLNVKRKKLLLEIVNIKQKLETTQYICIFDIESRLLEDCFVVYKGRCIKGTFYLNCNGYENGVVICLFYNLNEVRMYTKVGKKCFHLARSIYFPFHEYKRADFRCTVNRNNQILLFICSYKYFYVFDLLNLKNKVIICKLKGYDKYSNILPTQHFNESGEELYLFDKNKVDVYVYRSSVKTLAWLSAIVVSQKYTYEELVDMNLHKDLYSYL